MPTKFEKINQPIGELDRRYGPNVDVVADEVTAFVKGMHQAGLATSVKHFPGLGMVRGNTDYVTHVVDSTTTRHDPDLEGFSSGVTAGTDMATVSSAFYSTIDPGERAAFSTKVINTMLRGDLKFGGVVISDDLGAKGLNDTPVAQWALRFLMAGGDLVIVGDPTLAPAMVDAVHAQAQKDPRFAAQVTYKAKLVVAMKARRGLASCS